MACTVRALEFAHRRLAALSVLAGMESAEIYDRLFERLRHALIAVHAHALRDDASALLPLLDLLTSLQVDSMEPVGTGVLSQQGLGLATAGPALDPEITVILSSKVQLAIILPLEAGPETAAAMTLTTMLRTVGQDPCSANMLCLPSACVFRLAALFGSWPRRPCFGRFLGTGAFQMWPPFLFRLRLSPSMRFRVHGNA